MSTHTRQFPNVWADLLEDVAAAVESGESRREVLAWAEEQYDSYCADACGEIYGPGPAVFDVQGRF